MTQQPTPDHTPTTSPAAALHWAAAALHLADMRTAQGQPLTAAEHARYDRYQAAAHAHGHTDAQIRAYLTATRGGAR